MQREVEGQLVRGITEETREQGMVKECGQNKKLQIQLYQGPPRFLIRFPAELHLPSGLLERQRERGRW
jgi:hypothetical protein